MKKSKFFFLIYILIVSVLSVFVYLNADFILQYDTYSYGIVLILCVFANASILLPAPGLMVVVSASVVLNPIIVSVIAALGFTIGDSIGFFGGYTGKQTIGESEKESKLQRIFLKYDWLVVFIFGVLPLNVFDIIGIMAGYNKMKYYKFFVSCYLGKLIKSLFYAYGGTYIIEQIMNIIRDYYG